MFRTLKARGSGRRRNADQSKFLGGWSGGGRSRPSESVSSSARSAVRVGNRIGIAAAIEGSACVVFHTHMATSGQSWQSLLFCSSGQQGMSSEIDDMPVISATAHHFAAAGVSRGAAASPAITSAASKRPMSRRRSITYHHMGHGTLKGGFTSHVRQQAIAKSPKSAKIHRVNFNPTLAINLRQHAPAYPDRRTNNRSLSLTDCRSDRSQNTHDQKNH